MMGHVVIGLMSPCHLHFSTVMGRGSGLVSESCVVGKMASSVSATSESAIIADSESSTSTATDSESQTATLSLLSRLRVPQQSDLWRKQVVDHLPPPKGKRRARGTQFNEPKSISPIQKVKGFPKEFLCVSNHKLFCNACREELSLKKGVIANHVHSAKHEIGKSKQMSKEARERDIADTLLQSDKTSHPVGETLPIDHRVYRVKVIKTFFKGSSSIIQAR